MATKKTPPDPLLELAETDPATALEAARGRFAAVEKAAIRRALEMGDWFEKPAAELLKIPRATLRRMLSPDGAHADVGAEAARRRERAGYKGGNPHRPEK